MVAYRARRSRPTYRRTRRKLTANRVRAGSASARVQKKQIATLVRKTNRLSKAVSQARIYGQFYTQASNALMEAPWLIKPFHPNPTNRVAIFNDQTAISNAKGFKFTKFNMDYLVQPYTESSIIDMTMFIVSYQPLVAKKVHQETTLMTALVSGVDYHTTVGGLTFMNKGRFKIHYVKRLQTYENYTDGTPGTRGFTRGYLKRAISHKIVNESGEWTSVSDSEYPIEDRMFVVMFNNNSAVDLQYPTVSFNCLWSGHTCAY